MSDLVPSPSQLLGSQAYANPVVSGGAGDRIQGLMHGTQAFYQPSYVPSPRQSFYVVIC